jgi:tetratricopeptide (TPR) repeat protein
VFLITSVAVIGAAAIAILAVLVLRGNLTTVPKDGVDVEASNTKEMAALRARLADADGKLAAEQKKASEAVKARQNLELKLERAKIEAADLKGRLERLTSSLGYVLEAQALLERNSDLGGALSLVDAALKRDPGMLEAWRLKGRILSASGVEVKPALEAFERADKVARDYGGTGDAKALVLAGEVCLTDLDDDQRALRYYKRASELETDSSFRLAADARASQIENRADRAIEKANELAKAEPSLALAPLIAGEVLFEKARAEKSSAERGTLLGKADIYLAKALKLDPNSARGCLVRGRLLLEQSKLSSGFGFGMAVLGPQSKAERLLSTAKQLKPRIPEVHIALAELSLTRGALRNPAEALQSATEAVRLTGRRNAPALALLAQAHAANGSPGKAAVTMQEAMTIAPKNKEYIDLLRRYKEETQSLSR